MSAIQRPPASRGDQTRVGLRSAVPNQRCAIYTRVSTEHGLDMAFNSLDAQREACEAYIRSQKHEGWLCLPGMFNDGGYSGGSLERPDLQRLMVDIRAGRIDIVVVYKVDRLTRSLADFAKLVDLFDAHGVSFVSVTQAFNTTTSMGRLTLNVLLSFAQFEREVTGERIRDKIAASKKKGIRMGGPVPLGYALKDKTLIIDDAEAATVRSLFEGYLAHGSLTALMRQLDAQGIVTKRTFRKDGSIRGGVRFGKGALVYLLRNRIYLGQIIHKGQYYAARHPPIIDRDLFDRVQASLTQHGAQKRRRRLHTHEMFLLAGKLFDDRGNPMTPTLARKNGAHYRYYVSAALAQGRKAEAGTITRVNAQEIEDVLLQRLASDAPARMTAVSPLAASAPTRLNRATEGDVHDPMATSFPISLDAVLQTRPADQAALPSDHQGRLLVQTVERVVVSAAALQVSVKGDAAQSTLSPMTIPWSPTPHRRRRAIVQPASDHSSRPIRAETRARLLLGIARARRWVDDLMAGRVTDTHTIAAREGCSERSIRTNLNLAFLSPAIVKAALDGTLPAGRGITEFVNAPILWQRQC